LFHQYPGLEFCPVSGNPYTLNGVLQPFDHHRPLRFGIEKQIERRPVL